MMVARKANQVFHQKEEEIHIKLIIKAFLSITEIKLS